MTKRRKPPKRVETQVLMQSRRRCCLCVGVHNDHRVKGGQIAHLDDNPSNNDLDNLVWLCVEHHAQWHTRSTMTKGLTVGEVKEHRANLYRQLQNKAPEPDSGESPSEPTTTSAGTTGPVERAERRDSLLRQLDECIEQGESIRSAIGIERGQLRQRWTIGRNDGGCYREPDREIVDAERFVEWKTTCATVLGEIIPTAHPTHGSLPRQFNTLACGPDRLRWGIGTLRAIKRALQQGSLVV